MKSQSSDAPIDSLQTGWLWLCLLAGLAIRAALALGTDLYLDTAYSLAWSERLDWSYFDHAPMIAYFLRAFGTGGTDVITSLGTIGAIAWASEKVTPGSALRAATLASAMPCFIIGGALPNPDSVLYLFAALTLAFALRGHVVAAALTFGLAMLSKYPAILLAPALLGIAWYQPKRSRIALAVVISALIASPIVWWNVQHEWVGFRFQFEHGTKATPPSLTGFVELLGAQFALLGPVGLVLMARWSMKAKRPSADWALAAGFLVPLLVFLALGLKSRGEANWPTLAAVAGCIGMISFTKSTRLYWAAIGSSLVIAAVGLFFAIVPLNLQSPPAIVRRLHGYQVLRQLPTDVAVAYASHYGVAANIHHYTGLPVATINGRESQYDLWPVSPPPGSDALWLAEDEVMPPELAAQYESVGPPKALPGMFGTTVVHAFVWQRLQKRK